MKKIGEILLENGIIKPQDLERALVRQRDIPGKKIGEIMVEMGLITFDNLLRFLEIQLGMK